MGGATGGGRARLNGGSIKAKELGIQRGDPERGEHIAKKGERFTIEILAPEIAGTESRLSGSAQVEFLFFYKWLEWMVTVATVGQRE